jgi:Flp pilus assembly protein TadG
MQRDWEARAGRAQSSTHDRGQGLVEFAVSLVFLIILLAGISDLGRAFYFFVALREAAQEGAAYGSIARDYGEPESSVIADVEQRVRESSNKPIELESDPNVQVEVSLVDVNGTGVWCAENGVRVKVTYTFPVATPFLGTIIGGQTFQIPAVVQDTILRPPCP